MFDLRQFAGLSPDWYLRLHYYDELDSTNDEARKLAESGAKHGSVVLCDHQLAGRGRRGAQWLCEPGDGLLFSMLLRPTLPKAKWGRLALVAGLGIVEALNQKWAVGAQVKWPNDIYIGGSKCAGILVETQEDFAIVGIGVNVTGAPTSGDDRMDAVALADNISASMSRERVLAELLDGVFGQVNVCHEEFESQLSRLQKSCYLSGKRIRFTAHGDEFAGLVQGFDSDGGLRVEVDGELMSFSQASEISLV